MRKRYRTHRREEQTRQEQRRKGKRTAVVARCSPLVQRCTQAVGVRRMQVFPAVHIRLQRIRLAAAAAAAVVVDLRAVRSGSDTPSSQTQSKKGRAGDSEVEAVKSKVWLAECG